jgi:hypothetical protein
MTDIFAHSLGSTEVECRDRDSRHLSPLLLDSTRRRIDDLPRPIAHAIACSNIGVVTAPMAHAEGTVAVANTAQKVRQIDKVLSDEIGHAGRTLVAPADPHGPRWEDASEDVKLARLIAVLPEKPGRGHHPGKTIPRRDDSEGSDG